VNALIGIAAHPEANGEVYNVGSTHEITIMGLAERIREMTNSKSRIVTVPYDTAYEDGFEDMRRRVPDIGKVNRLIGYEPKVSLDEALRSIIEDQRARLHASGVLTFA
jgi:UDP-glucose 4-epimerase